MIFKQFAHNYLDAGYSIIPLHPKDKKPIFNGWQKYCIEKPSEKQVEEWCRNLPNSNIGLCLGPASQVVALDFDYGYDPNKCEVSLEKFTKDKAFIENELITNFLQGETVRKKADKGWTAFYQYTGSEENMACNRYGIRLFDFLCSGRQTVMPPSVHPSGKHYAFIDGEDLMHMAPSDLIIINHEALKEFRAYYGSGGSASQVGGRHGIILMYALSVIAHCESADELAEVMVKKDKEVNEAPYFSDIKYFRSNDPIKNAKSWIPRIINFYRKDKPDWNFGRKPKRSTKNYESFDLFFNKLMPDAKKEVLRDTVLIRYHGRWQPVDNRLDYLKSEAIDKGLADSKVKQHLAKWTFLKKPEFLVDFTKESKDTQIVDEFLSNVKVSNIDHKYFVELFKDWGAKVFGRAYDSDVQNRLLVLKGKQGIGKDVFISRLFNGLDLYFSSISVYDQPNRNFEQIQGLLVANVPEIDNYKQVSVETLKDMVTRNEATFRAAYAMKSDEIRLHCSFISTCNRDDFLRDTTGNRRFLIFDVESIDWKYPKDKSLDLMRAFWRLYKDGFKASQGAEDAMNDYVERQSPQDISNEVLEIFDERIANLTKRTQGVSEFKFSEIFPILDDLQRSFGRRFNHQAVCGMLRKTHRSTRRKYGVVYHLPRCGMVDAFGNVIDIEHKHTPNTPSNLVPINGKYLKSDDYQNYDK